MFEITDAIILRSDKHLLQQKVFWWIQILTVVGFIGIKKYSPPQFF